MNKRKVEITECSDIINEKLKKGIFLTSRSGDKVNSMVIGWGHIGRIWERPVFIAYVRTSRFTSEIIDSNPEFTVNVPVNGFTRKAFALCGMRSGRDIDKISMAELNLVEPEVVSVPAIKEFPLTLECRVIYRQEQDISLLPEDIKKQFYGDAEPADHICYYGQIVAAYMIEE